MLRLSSILYLAVVFVAVLLSLVDSCRNPMLFNAKMISACERFGLREPKDRYRWTNKRENESPFQSFNRGLNLRFGGVPDWEQCESPTWAPQYGCMLGYFTADYVAKFSIGVKLDQAETDLDTWIDAKDFNEKVLRAMAFGGALSRRSISPLDMIFKAREPWLIDYVYDGWALSESGPRGAFFTLENCAKASSLDHRAACEFGVGRAVALDPMAHQEDFKKTEAYQKGYSYTSALLAGSNPNVDSCRSKKHLVHCL